MLSRKLRQILYGYKKGASRCIYLDEALQCLYSINANDPRPQRAVVYTRTKLVQQTEIYRKKVYLRERSPCSRILEICRFHLENKS